MIADDHQIMREGLGLLIHAEPTMELVAEAETGREAIEMARRHKPDVVTMDISMPDMNGIEATREIVKEHPWIKVIALSTHSDRNYLQEIFRAGAKGFLQKDCAFSELVLAVSTIQGGQPYLGKTMTGIVVEDILCAESMSSGDVGPSLLTERETEVLRLMAQEMDTKDIAGNLNIGVKTVETYQSRMKKKLNIFNLVGLTKYALRQGLVLLNEPPRKE
jgi:DNA-binding NarL/FixJ family response regulator